jgi:hypothetical protein
MTTKKCSKCGEEKDINEFAIDKNRKDGRYCYCKLCVCKLSENHYKTNSEKYLAKQKEYRINNKDKISKYAKEYGEKNKDKRKDNKLNRTYGISLEEYKIMAYKQSGVCLICGKEPIENGNNGTNNILVVDHNHTTGKVRGLLCGKCNKAIGLLHDDISILKSAIEYLEKHQ